MISVITYHYIRPLADTAFPNIKGLELGLFEAQLAHILRHYTVIRASDIVAAVKVGKPVPARAAVLRFDDGYSDHIRYVFPLLRTYGVTGIFFPVSSAVMQRSILQVNKIQHILAATSETLDLVSFIESRVRDEMPYAERSISDYRQQYWRPSRRDPPEVSYIKKMLQNALPAPIRISLVDEMFATFVSSDASGFANDLYLSVDELSTMVEAGMEVGSHGHAHAWLDTMSAEAQGADIDSSLEMLGRIGLSKTEFMFCYPYGRYNLDSLSVLTERSCAAAFSLKRGPFDVPGIELLELPQIDTNDLPGFYCGKSQSFA